MKYFSAVLILISIASVKGQDISELVRRNGFKDIKLGSPVDSIKGAQFEKNIVEFKEFEARQYEIRNPEYEKIGEAEVKEVKVKTYKGLIYEIIVTTPKDPRIMRGLEKSYGKATYNIRTETYNWQAPQQLGLTYRGHHKKEITLIYRSYPMVKLMYGDKHKKIEAIAEDF